MSDTDESQLIELQRLLTTAPESDHDADQLRATIERLGTSTDALRAYRERSKNVVQDVSLVETPELRISTTTS